MRAAGATFVPLTGVDKFNARARAGGGKTTTIGKLAHKFTSAGASVLVARAAAVVLAPLSQRAAPSLKRIISREPSHHTSNLLRSQRPAPRDSRADPPRPVSLASQVPGDTFRAAAGEQLQVWAERAGAKFHEVRRNTGTPLRRGRRGGRPSEHTVAQSRFWALQALPGCFWRPPVHELP